MDGSIVSQYLGENVRDLKKSKPSQEAVENARFFLSLFKHQKLILQG